MPQAQNISSILHFLTVQQQEQQDQDCILTTCPDSPGGPCGPCRREINTEVYEGTQYDTHMCEIVNE